MSEVLYEAHPAMFRNHPFGFIGSVILIPVVAGIIILLVWYVKCRTETLTITKEDLRYVKGILSKANSEVKLSGIRSVKVRQTLLQRIFGTGDVDIYTAGDTPEVIALGMPNPDEINKLINEYS